MISLIQITQLQPPFVLEESEGGPTITGQWANVIRCQSSNLRINVKSKNERITCQSANERIG